MAKKVAAWLIGEGNILVVVALKEVSSDGGIVLRIFVDDEDGIGEEVLRTDAFRENPHTHHVSPWPDLVNSISLINRDVDPLEVAVEMIAKLPEYLRDPRVSRPDMADSLAGEDLVAFSEEVRSTLNLLDGAGACA